MKKILLVSFILSFFQLTVYSQHCLPEGITFETQAQIDSFQVNYPECRVIEGDVRIGGDDISNLDGLNVIDSVLGNVKIGGGDDLINLSGLESLKYIGESFWIGFSENLRYLSGINNLRTVHGSMYIEFNDRLTSITGFQNLSSVGELYIESNDELVSFSGLGNLDSITWSLSIINNYMLKSLDGLSSLSKINGEIVISFNESLSILTGLESLTSIGDAIRIYENDSLVSLSGLDNVDPSTLGIVEIWRNPLLSECDIQSICSFLSDPPGSVYIYHNAAGCNNPHEIADSCGIELPCLPFGSYQFHSQADVDSFPSYFPDCHRLEGHVNIRGENIINLDSLFGIDTINGSLMICGNNNLSNLEGLHNLEYIRDDLDLGYWECGGNEGLTNLSGLNKLKSVGRSMLIMSNDGLENLEGLDSLTSVGYSLQISENSSLKSLEGIENLHSVTFLEIGYNDSLISLDGLQGLVNVEYYIDIAGNPILTGINGIENIYVDSLWSILISDNDSLSECSVRSVCDYLNIPEANTNIHDNAPGCNSQEEVELACGVGVEEVDSRQSLVVSYPNPVADLVTFDIQMPESAKVKLTIFNSLGEAVVTILDETLREGQHLIFSNLEDLPTGIYFYTLTTDDPAKPDVASLRCRLTTGKLLITR